MGSSLITECVYYIYYVRSHVLFCFSVVVMYKQCSFEKCHELNEK